MSGREMVIILMMAMVDGLTSNKKLKNDKNPQPASHVKVKGWNWYTFC